MTTSGQCQYVGTKAGSEESTAVRRSASAKPHSLFGTKKIRTGVCLDYLPEARVGDYVLVSRRLRPDLARPCARIRALTTPRDAVRAKQYTAPIVPQ